MILRRSVSFSRTNSCQPRLALARARRNGTEDKRSSPALASRCCTKERIARSVSRRCSANKILWLLAVAFRANWLSHSANGNGSRAIFAVSRRSACKFARSFDVIGPFVSARKSISVLGNFVRFLQTPRESDKAISKLSVHSAELSDYWRCWAMCESAVATTSHRRYSFIKVSMELIYSYTICFTLRSRHRPLGRLNQLLIENEIVSLSDASEQL